MSHRELTNQENHALKALKGGPLFRNKYGGWFTQDKGGGSVKVCGTQTINQLAGLGLVVIHREKKATLMPEELKGKKP